MRVGLLPTCAVDILAPEVGTATVRLLERLGIEVVVPRESTCCGQPAFNAGHWPEAGRVASGFLAAAQQLLDAGADWVILPSGSCAAMVRHGWDALFAENPARHGEAVSAQARVQELSQFLVHVLGVEDVGAVFEGAAVYHPSCHGRRILGITDEPLRLLRHVQGLTLQELPYAQDCCGFGGTFSVKLPDVSSAMVGEKARHAREAGADLLITNDMGCGINIRGRLQRDGSALAVRHWVEILASA